MVKRSVPPYTVRVFRDNIEIATHFKERTIAEARKVARAELKGWAKSQPRRYLSTVTDSNQAVVAAFEAHERGVHFIRITHLKRGTK